jgi:hypothetical protein
MKEKDGERGNDTTFIAGKENFKARNIFKDCLIVPLVKVSWS